MPELITELQPGLSVIVPVYNSEGSLPALAERIEKVLGQIGLPFEMVLVNDGSRDGSWGVIQKLAQERTWIHGINLMRNYGQHNTLLCGIRDARFDIIVTIDDDLQNPPEEIPKLLAKLNEGFDVVYGTPQIQQHGFLRNMASTITKMALQSATGAEVARKVSAFRMFRTHVRDGFDSYRSPFVSIDVLLTWATTRFASVPVAHDPRKLGTSNYTIKKLVIHAINMMTGYSTAPLRFASLTGFACTLFGIGILVYVIVRYFTVSANVAGFPFLASVIAIFSGAQLFALGIMGEYLARMHFRMMDRPGYTVRGVTRTGALR